MLFKVLLLVAVCSTLVASKDLHQRDTLAAKAHEDVKKSKTGFMDKFKERLKLPHKDVKRDDETAKKSVAAELLLEDVGIDVGGESIRAPTGPGAKVQKKRHVEVDHQDQKECCG